MYYFYALHFLLKLVFIAQIQTIAAKYILLLVKLVYTQIKISYEEYISKLYTSKEWNITNPIHMWIRFFFFFKKNTYIPNLINQLNGRKMFFIKLDSNTFYKRGQFLVNFCCCPLHKQNPFLAQKYRKFPPFSQTREG